MKSTAENTIQQIVTLLEKEGKLHRKGRSYYCPYCEDPHTSNSPSFAVSPERKSARCFSDKCGRRVSGLRGFVQLYADLKGLSFSRAVSELKAHGIEVPFEENWLESLFQYFRSRTMDVSPLTRSFFSFMKKRGVDVRSQAFSEYPVAALLPPPDNLRIPEEAAKLLEVGTTAAVYAYYDAEGTIRALKIVPFDPNTGKQLKEQTRVLRDDKYKKSDLYFGPSWALGEEEDVVYVVEGEIDALVVGTKTGVPVIAFGGTASTKSRADYPDKTYVILPDAFGRKKGEDVAFSYVRSLWRPVKVAWPDYEEDPAEAFRPLDYHQAKAKLQELLRGSKEAAEFVAWYVREKGISLRSLLGELPTEILAEAATLLGESPVSLLRGGTLSIETLYEVLSRDFRVLTVESRPDEDVAYVQHGKKVARVRWSPARLLSMISTLTGEDPLTYFMRRVPLSDEILFDRKGRPRTDLEILKLLTPYAIQAFERMKAEAAARGITPDRILRRGIYYLEEEGVVVLVSGSRVFLWDGREVKQVQNFLLGRHVVIPDEEEDWLEDFDFSLIEQVEPKAVYEEVEQFFRKVIRFKERYEYQYRLLALLPFYGLLFDAFKDRVLLILFNGDSGSGKTTTMKYIVTSQREVGWHKLALNSDFFANYSPAGLRQSLNGKRLLVGLDEAEPEVLDRLMDEFRSMVSADAKAVRGSKEQVASTQENRFAAIMSSVALPERPQNLNRLLVFRFHKFKGVPTPVLALKKGGYTYDKLKELSHKVLATTLKVMLRAPEERAKSEETVAEALKEVSARDVEAYSVLHATASLLGVDVLPELKKLAEEMERIRNVPEMKDRLLHEILNAQIHVEGRGQMSLAELVFALERDEGLRERMAARGIYVLKGGVVSFPLTHFVRSLSVNQSTLNAYLAEDEDGIIRADGTRIYIDARLLKEKFTEFVGEVEVEKEIDYQGGKF